MLSTHYLGHVAMFFQGVSLCYKVYFDSDMKLQETILKELIVIVIVDSSNSAKATCQSCALATIFTLAGVLRYHSPHMTRAGYSERQRAPVTRSSDWSDGKGSSALWQGKLLVDRHPVFGAIHK